jgi:cytochrome c oxidase subunit II
MDLAPDRATTFAEEVDLLFGFLTGISGFMSVLIALGLAYFAIRYRKSNLKVNRDLPPTEAIKVEIAWTVLPLVAFLGIFFWGARLYLVWASPPADSLEIYGVGKQWMWKFQHTEGRREINELHVPVGRPVRVVLASEDVIHAFYVPAFRVKMDVVPGRYTTLWFQAKEAGEYHLFCAEYCGTGHSRMIGKVIAIPESTYQDWLGGGGGEETLAQRGAVLFEQLGCKSCHEPESTAAVPAGDLSAAVRGPPLIGLFNKKVRLADGSELVADEDYLRESIMRPQAKIVEGYKPLMPTYVGQIDEEGLAALVAHLKTSLEPEVTADLSETGR